MKIMIVDDSKRMRQMIRIFIADLSSDIVECEDGSEAIISKSDLLPLRSILATI